MGIYKDRACRFKYIKPNIEMIATQRDDEDMPDTPLFKIHIAGVFILAQSSLALEYWASSVGVEVAWADVFCIFVPLLLTTMLVWIFSFLRTGVHTVAGFVDFLRRPRRPSEPRHSVLWIAPFVAFLFFFSLGTAVCYKTLVRLCGITDPYLIVPVTVGAVAVGVFIVFSWFESYQRDARTDAMIAQIRESERMRNLAAPVPSTFVIRVRLPVLRIDEERATEAKEGRVQQIDINKNPPFRSLCAACRVSRVDTVFVDCGHASMCVVCSHKHVEAKLLLKVAPKCPICRCPVTRIIRVYDSGVPETCCLALQPCSDATTIAQNPGLI